ncbi:MAG TPA: tetratricopeptide repeat protein [Myxococcales bacterium]
MLESVKVRLESWLCAALLAALSLSAFSPAASFSFVGLDDGDYITGNPHIQHGFTRASLAWAFTRFHFSSWHPLTWMSHMLDWTLWGPAASGHHLTSVMLHAANGVLLFVFLLQATRLLLPSFFTAALFAVHPLRVESVVWISERKDVLSAFFFLFTLLAWLAWVRRPGLWRYLLVFALLAAGLASKPMLVTAPLVLLLLDVWPLRRFPGLPWRRLVLEKIPLFGLSLLSGLLTLQAQGAGGAVNRTIPLAAGILHALDGCATYLMMTLWPARLAVHYPLQSERWPVLLGSAALLAAATAVCVWQRRERPQLLVGWLWFVVMLLPVVGVIQVGSQSVADRYTYLPLIGLFFALSFSLPWGAGRLLPTGAAAVIALLYLLTLRQETFWRDTHALFAHALEISPGDPLAEQALANDLLAAGKLDEAEAGFREVLRQWPRSGRALNAMGLIALRRGDPQAALRWFQLAFAVEPDPTLVAPAMAQTLTRLGRATEAVQLLEPLDPEYPVLQRELGIALAIVGRRKEAEERLRHSAQLEPRDAATQLNLGSLLAREGRFAEAIGHFQSALEIDPALESARQQLDLARRDAIRTSETR